MPLILQIMAGYLRTLQASIPASLIAMQAGEAGDTIWACAAAVVRGKRQIPMVCLPILILPKPEM